MKIIKPITITPEMIVSNAVETYGDWTGVVGYSLTDKVVYENRIYESLVNSNINNNPATNPEKWLDIAPSNKTAFMDGSYTTQTTGSTELIVDITPGVICNSIAILNIEGSTIKVEMFFESALIYSKQISLDRSYVVNWYDYFFGEFFSVKDVVLLDLIPYGGATIRVTITSPTPKVGIISVGNSSTLGGTQYGVNFGVKDYSVKQEDDFGNTVFVQRNFSKRLDASVMVDNISLQKVYTLLTEIRSKPTIFIPTEEEGYDSLITYGFLYDWNLEIPYPTSSMLRLDIKGLT